MAAPDEDLQEISRLPVAIHAQYIKDMSIENPNSPESLRMSGKPSMDVNFSMDARKIEDGEAGSALYEVILGVEVTAKRDDKVAFLVELSYGTLLSLHGVPEEQTHPLLLIEIPRLSFPFVRQIVADMTQQAGFAPLLLTPVDFRDFYIQRYGAAGQPAAKSA